jgi:hypothetical protein
VKKPAPAAEIPVEPAPEIGAAPTRAENRAITKVEPAKNIFLKTTSGVSFYRRKAKRSVGNFVHRESAMTPYGIRYIQCVK